MAKATVDYQRLLDQMHQHILPRCYLEIGVRTGGSARLALPGTKAILVDPAPAIRFALPEYHFLEAVTSDDFFASRTSAVGLSPGDIDLAYIDGMHLFEFALRDFLNVERYCRPDSVVVLDDCVPRNARMAQRERETVAWAGDVWKVLLVLREIDPNLNMVLLDVEPAGMAVITGANPNRNLTHHEIETLQHKFMDADFGAFAGSLGDTKSHLPPTWQSVSSLMPEEGHRNEPVASLVAARDARRDGWRQAMARGGRGIVTKMPDGLRTRIAPTVRRLSGQS